MIVGDLRLIRVASFPDEAEAIAVVDPDAVLSGAVVFQCFQRIARRAEIVQRRGRVKLKQSSNGSLFDGLKLSGSDPKEYLLGFDIPKRSDRILSYIDRR